MITCSQEVDEWGRDEEEDEEGTCPDFQISVKRSIQLTLDVHGATNRGSSVSLSDSQVCLDCSFPSLLSWSPPLHRMVIKVCLLYGQPPLYIILYRGTHPWIYSNIVIPQTDWFERDDYTRQRPLLLLLLLAAAVVVVGGEEHYLHYTTKYVWILGGNSSKNKTTNGGI